jgi:glycerol-3-phosphate dehydrogenase
MNLVTRQIIPHYAVGITSRSKDTRAAQNPRMLFISPWRRYSLLGTIHSSYNGTPDDYRVTEQSIQTFIDEVNHAYPGGALTRNDVYFVHKGFLPAQATQQEDSVKLVRQGQIHDHQNDDRVEGLITVVGVKYTTARNIAEQAVNLVFEKLGKQPSPCRTHLIPLHGGRIERLEAFLEQEINMTAYGLGSDVIQHLVYNYGLEYRQVLRYLDDDSTLGQTVRASSAVIKAEILHAVREEMAMKLTDVLFRRTELASPAYPGNACLQTCADLIAPTLGWSETKTQQELEEVKAIFSTLNTQQTNDA